MQKELFDLVNYIGDGLFTSIHIIDISDECEQGKKYRVYHSDGFCFNTEREEIDDIENFISEFGNINIDNYYYNFDSDLFEGFKTISIEDAVILIKKIKTQL